MGLEEKLSSDVVVSTLINFAQKIRGLVFIPIITKTLGTASYGAFIQVLTIATIFATLSRLGFEQALIRYAQGRESEDRGRLYISLTVATLAFGTVFTGVVFTTATELSAVFLDTDRYASVFRIGSVLIPIYVIQVMAQNWYRAEMNVKRYSILEGIKTYLNVTTVIIVVLVLNWSLEALVAAVVGVELLFALMLQITVLRTTGIHRPSVAEFGTYIRYSIPVSVVDLLGMFQDRADRLFIGFFLGANAVGIYSIAYSVAKLLRMYTLPLRLTFFPEFSRLWEDGQQDDCYRFLRNGSRYLVGLAIPSVVGLYLIGESLVELLSSVEAAAQAPLLLPVIALGIMFIGLETLYRQLFYAAEDTTAVSAVRTGSTLVNVVLNVVLIPVYGIVGAALATLLANFVGLFIISFLANRRFRTAFEPIFLLKVLGATAVMYIVAILSGIQHISILVLVCPGIYLSALVVLRGVRVAELKFILRSVQTTFTQ